MSLSLSLSVCRCADVVAACQLADLARGKERATYGAAAVAAQRYADAVPALSAALEVAPQAVRLRLLRADASEALGDAEAAMADWKRAAALAGDDPNLFRRIAAAHIRLGELDAATEYVHAVCVGLWASYRRLMALG
jgi:tetratricopeptide (TPR) repeat protein